MCVPQVFYHVIANKTFVQGLFSKFWFQTSAARGIMRDVKSLLAVNQTITLDVYIRFSATVWNIFDAVNIKELMSLLAV